MDASKEGWGAFIESSDGNKSTGGRWQEEKEFHINVLELKAFFLGLRSLLMCTHTHSGADLEHHGFDVH